MKVELLSPSKLRWLAIVAGLLLAAGSVFLFGQSAPADGAAVWQLVVSLAATATATTLALRLAAARAMAQDRGAGQERQVRTAMLAAAFGEELHACRSVQEACELLNRRAATVLPQLAGVLYLLDEGSYGLRAATRWGAPRSAVNHFSPGACQALRHSDPWCVDESRTVAGCTHFDAAPPANYCCLPLHAQGDSVGMLHLQYAGSDPGALPVWDDARMALAMSVAQKLALALANLRLRQRLVGQATHDTLTGLHNRAYMAEWFDQELHRAARRGYPIGVIMLDLDHFKRINDSFGHEAGDRVLRDISNLLRARARRSDVVCRYGGEEFLVLMPEASAASTLAKATYLLAEIEHRTLEHAGIALGPLTASAGVAAYPSDATSVDGLLRCADDAMYAAKEQGRNRVTVFEPAATAQSGPPA